ncbi:MAG TPA: GAF domain-containing SpoIIE family protein phosphatase, partial [Candidatus Methylacidiphilales bacterium]|nr:GAF domain-containing SpoIIE family protein phosphatase [Candidatus Methylacidiphilales bacterium]
MTILPPAWPGAPELTIDPLAESARVDELLTLKLLDTPPEYRFDRITRLAADFFQVPVAYVALIDENRQWLKSQVGISSLETPRCMTFCQYTIQQEAPLVMTNAQEHPIGAGHPWVVGDPYVRFYAGVPLSGPTGKKIGTFCLVDFAVREFSEKDLASLVAFGSLVEREINLGEIIQTQHELLEIRKRLLQTQHALEQEFADAAKYVRMLLPPPLNNHEIVDWAYHPSMRLGGDGLGYRRLTDDLLSVYILDVTGHGLGSALLAVTLLEVLRNPAVQVDFTKPSVVIERLNRTFPMQDHGGKFFSAWYGVYSRSRQELTFANAGNPPALLYTHENGKAGLRRTAPGTSVLGVLPMVDIPECTTPFPPGAELFLFSDG